MPKMLFFCLAVLALGLGSASAADSARLPASGAAFCPDLDELKSYMTALFNKDKEKVDALTDCVVFKGNLKIDIIDDTISDPAAREKLGMWIDKVRVYMSHKSIVGYAWMSKE